MKIKSSYQPGAGLGHVRRFSFSSRSTGVSIVGFCGVVGGSPVVVERARVGAGW